MKHAYRKPAIIATAAAAGVVAIAVGITASQSASAASGSPSPKPSGRPSGIPGWGGPGGLGGPGDLHGHGRGGFGGPGFGGPGLGGPGGQLLHGTEVVQQGKKVVTVEEQAGKVTAVSATSITVKSADGFTETYVVSSTTQIGKKGAAAKISAVAVGDTVRIEGVKSGSTVTASHLMDGVPTMPAFGGGPRGWNGSTTPPTAPPSPGAGA